MNDLMAPHPGPPHEWEGVSASRLIKIHLIAPPVSITRPLFLHGLSCCTAHGALQLFEGTDLNLAYPFAADIIFLA